MIVNALASTAESRRILVINPNTNPLVTARVRAMADRCEVSDAAFEVINPALGPFSIESESDKQQAEVEVLKLIGDRAHLDYDAYVLACFDDLALQPARQMVTAPVIGCCQAGIEAARSVSPALAIVTTVVAAVPGIHLMMKRYGAGDQATVRAAGIGVDDAARSQPQAQLRLMQTIEQAVDEDSAQVILLASAGLTGQADRISAQAGVPVIDAVEAALRQAVLACRQRSTPTHPIDV
jgi:allantoin racemase